MFGVYCALFAFVGVLGVHRSIISTFGTCGSITGSVGEHRSITSLADTENDVVVAAAVCDIVGVFGVVPIDIVAIGVLGIVPNEVILIGVLESVPVDTIVAMAEPKRMVVGCRSSRVSIIPYTFNDASLVV